MKSENINYFPEFDHIRAFAAILIILYHGFHLISYHLLYNAPPAPDHWPLASNIFYSLIIEGHSAVALFMVLSGFIFTIGTASDQEIIYHRFIQNRLLRTYPMFILLAITGIYAFPGNFSFMSFIQSVFFFSNASGAFQGGSFTGMFWTISVEWQFYLIFPFMIRILNRKGWLHIAGLIPVFMIMRILACLEGADARDLAYWTITGRMDQFVIGILFGVYYRKKIAEGSSSSPVFCLSPVAVCLILYFFNRLGGWPSKDIWKIFWPALEGLAWGGVIAGYSLFYKYVPLFISRVMTYTGTISYSLYLVHFIVIQCCIRNNLLISFNWLTPAWTAVFNTVFLIIPLTVLVSAITFTFVESPFLEMRVKYKRTV